MRRIEPWNAKNGETWHTARFGVIARTQNPDSIATIITCVTKTQMPRWQLTNGRGSSSEWEWRISGRRYVLHQFREAGTADGPATHRLERVPYCRVISSGPDRRTGR